MKKENSKQPEKCSLISGDVQRKNPFSRKLLFVIILLLIAVFSAILLSKVLKKYYYLFIHPSENNENSVTINVNKINLKYLNLNGTGIVNKSLYKKNSENICRKVIALQSKSAVITKETFYEGSVYFIKNDEAMTDQEACALESVLHNYPNNKTHLIEFLCNRPKEILEGTDFIKLLAINYKNLIFTSIEGNAFFKDTPVEGHWACDDDTALFKAKILTLWLQGGAIMSFDLLLNVPNILIRDDEYFSELVMLSKKKCNSFLFMIMKQLAHRNNITITNMLKKEIVHFKQMNQQSVVKFIDSKNICNHFNLACPFLLIEELQKTTGAWAAQFAQLCPIIIKQFQNKV